MLRSAGRARRGFAPYLHQGVRTLRGFTPIPPRGPDAAILRRSGEFSPPTIAQGAVWRPGSRRHSRSRYSNRHWRFQRGASERRCVRTDAEDSPFFSPAGGSLMQRSRGGVMLNPPPSHFGRQFGRGSKQGKDLERKDGSPPPEFQLGEGNPAVCCLLPMYRL